MPLRAFTVEDLQRLEIFRALSRSDLQPLAKREFARHYPAGSVLFQQGAQADFLVLVVEGQLRAWSEVDDQQEPLGTIFPGEVAGESALAHRGGVRTLTLRATRPTLVLHLTTDDLAALKGKRVLAVIQRQMMISTARRLRTTNHAMRRVWKRYNANGDTVEHPSSGVWAQFLSALGRFL